MKKFKGTKAEWKVENESHELFGVDNYNHIIAGNGYFDDKSKSGFSIQTLISDSDARLIVAAPKLLMALQSIRNAAIELGLFSDDDSGLSLEIAMANHVINEALGEE